MSALRDRLRQLRGQTGNPNTAESSVQSTGFESLPSKLARLRVSASPVAAKNGVGIANLANTLGCRLSATQVLVRSSLVAAGSMHGESRIQGGLAAVEALLPGLDDPARGTEVALLDCETTGLSGGTGTVAFMVGIARLRPSGVAFTQLLIPRFAAETAMLSCLKKALDGVGVLVTYNGKSFDQPLLQSRYRLCGLDNPFTDLAHLDLLGVTRRLFARHWPNCRLATAEDRLLGFRRHDDLPGSEAPQAWLDWLRQGKTRNLKRVFEHNRWDLLSLAALLPILAETCLGLEHPGADSRAVARCLTERHGPEAGLRHLCTRRDRLDSAELLEMAGLAKKVRDWDLALTLWKELATQGSPRALLELAIYEEHRGGDLAAALEATERLLRLEGEAAALRHRRGRLLGKLANGPGVAGKQAKLR